MSATKLTIKEVEKKAKGQPQKYITLQYYEGNDKPEITLEVTEDPDRIFHYFVNSSKTGRRKITRSDAQKLLNEYNIYSS